MSISPRTLCVWWKRTRHESDLYAKGASGSTLNFILHALSGKRQSMRFVEGRGFVNGFEQSLLEELTARGFDVTTLRLQVRGYKHLWIVPGQLLQHRTTGAWVRVHHVRYQRGAADVMLVPYAPHDHGDSEHVSDIARRTPYVPIADVEQGYACFDHPNSWLSQEARSALRPWCIMCGEIRERANGVLVCPKGCGENALVEAMIDRERT